MHKARENGNGSFSIGKTWVLDDLTVIESYTNSVPTTAEQQQNKQRAGSVGFTVTVQKPYYWQAATAKEKEFFIFSLIKIFKKYTGGRLPQLLGFGSQEIDQLGGLPGGPTSQPKSTSTAPPVPAPRTIGRETTPARSADALPNDIQTAVSRDRRQRPSQERISPERSQPGINSQEPNRALRNAASQDRPLRSANSSDRMYVPGSFPSSESVNTQSAGSQLNEKKSPSPIPQATQLPPQSSRRQQPTAAANGHDSHQQNNRSGRQISPERTRPNGTVPASLRVAAPSRSEAHGDRISANAKEMTAQIPSPSDFQAPPHLTNRTYKSEASRVPHETTSANGNAKTFSVSRTTRKQPIDEAPSMQRPDPGSDRISEDGRPITASNAAGVSAGDRSKDATSDMATVQHGTLPPHNATTQESGMDVPTQEHRPGLGPMIKKKSTKEIASTFRRAATAANAFKPRAGGPVDRSQADISSGGDGITGVFQAPSLLRGLSQETSRSTTPAQGNASRPSTPATQVDASSVPSSLNPVRSATPKIGATSGQVQESKATSPEKAAVPEGKPAGDHRKRKRSDHSTKYAEILGVHPSLLEGRTFEIEDVLSDFGWSGESRQKASFEGLQSGIRKELANIEAGSWLGTVESNDDRTAGVGDMLDKVMAECEELDCLLTLYNVELGVSWPSHDVKFSFLIRWQTLSEDVAYIEAQSQGLQVQTANQKLLHTELSNLLETISISSTDLGVLKDASLTHTKDILDVEHTLAQLYAAMVTIDPKLRTNGLPTREQASHHRSSNTGHSAGELSSMHAVRERRDGYRRESLGFIQRLKEHMSIKFRETEAQNSDALERKRRSISAARASSNPLPGQEYDSLPSLDWHIRDEPKQALWLYSPLLLFAREVEPMEWESLLHIYETYAKKSYQDEYKEHCGHWKQRTRNPYGNEDDVLFTAQEKETENIVGRKLTVKRSKTVRVDGTNRISSNEKPIDGKVAAYEAVAGALTDTAMSIFVEQNFIVAFFHASSTISQDFIDAIATEPDQRGAINLIRKMPFDTDREMARKVLNVMEEIYAFWPSDMQSMVDWAIKQDPLNGVGILYALESQLASTEETNQEFLNQAVSKIHDRLTIHFSRFIEEQVRGIEDTKVKIKKRKGVIAFMKVFPNFTITVENMLPPVHGLEHLPVRGMVNDAYGTLNKAMFESLKFIAKEAPSATSSTSMTGDPEDKEALNHHILLIENMNHYIEEVPHRNNVYNPVLDDWVFRAGREMSEHMDAYLSAIIRRPLGKLLDYLESTETLIKNSLHPSSIATRASHSRSVFKKVLSSYDAKEIRKGVDTLKRRVEKHFGEGDDSPGLSSKLISKVLKECQNRYENISARVDRISREVYDGSLEVEWKKEDVIAAFKR